MAAAERSLSPPEQPALRFCVEHHEISAGEMPMTTSRSLPHRDGRRSARN